MVVLLLVSLVILYPRRIFRIIFRWRHRPTKSVFGTIPSVSLRRGRNNSKSVRSVGYVLGGIKCLLVVEAMVKIVDSLTHLHSIVESLDDKEKCVLKAKVTSDGSSGLSLLRAAYTLVAILMLGFLLIFCLQGNVHQKKRRCILSSFLGWLFVSLSLSLL